MDKFTDHESKCCLGAGPKGSDLDRAAPFREDPADRLERELAAVDLTDAAQAATRAAIAREHGDLAASLRLSRVAQHLYDRADIHRRCAEHAQPAGPRSLITTSSSTTPYSASPEQDPPVMDYPL